jgi:hypothetical protein
MKIGGGGGGELSDVWGVGGIHKNNIQKKKDKSSFDFWDCNKKTLFL